MDSYTETFGSWQGNAPAGAAVLRVPVSAASYEVTGASFAGTAVMSAADLGQPTTVVATRTHKSIRPGTPPRGRLR